MAKKYRLHNAGRRCKAGTSELVYRVAAAMAARVERGVKPASGVTIVGYSWSVQVAPLAGCVSVMPCDRLESPVMRLRGKQPTCEKGFALSAYDVRKHGANAIADQCSKIISRSELCYRA